MTATLSLGRPGVIDWALPGDVYQVHPIGQDAIGVAYVYREQPRLAPKLWAAVSPRRGDRDEF